VVFVHGGCGGNGEMLLAGLGGVERWWMLYDRQADILLAFLIGVMVYLLSY